MIVKHFILNNFKIKPDVEKGEQYCCKENLNILTAENLFSELNENRYLTFFLQKIYNKLIEVTYLISLPIIK